jgi:hypothetical protein
MGRRLEGWGWKSKGEIVGRKRNKEKVESAEVGVIKRSGFGAKRDSCVLGVDTPERFIVGRGPGFFRRVKRQAAHPSCTSVKHLHMRIVPQSGLWCRPVS